MIRQYELVERVREYDPNLDEDTLNRAYVFALKAHGSQTRASGDPYFSHPLEVAGILTNMRLDAASIVTALLHDVVEDTAVSLPEIEKAFGSEIRRLVDGVTKLSRLDLQSEPVKQAENFRKLVLAMSEDIRVLLVKLADRLHNMRTLHYIKDAAKRRRIAAETMEIYAPLAERIGLNDMKDQLEDLAFAELNAEARQSILARLEFLRQNRPDRVLAVQIALKNTLDQAGLASTIQGREKSPWSIWRKMEKKNIAFEQLSDIMAFRLLVDSVEQCYQALGIIHSHYAVVPGRFKDYISTPKPNDYQSIHTCVIGPEKQRIEIQIRTHAMQEVADRGVAAHWNYKADQGVPRTDGRQYQWLRELLDILEHSPGPEEFLDNTRLAMFQDQVFCFTPKGDLYALPRNACPIDFAYAVHSDIGDHCVGARVNGRIVPLRASLNNGDQVEILTSKTQKPSPDWEEFVVTGKAKARIRRFYRLQNRAEYVQLGRDSITRLFRQEGLNFSDATLSNLLADFKCSSLDDLYAAVGEGLHSPRDIVNAAYPAARTQTKLAAPRPMLPRLAAKPTGDAETTPRDSAKQPIRGVFPGLAVHYAGCCHPLPGDRIVGIVTTGKGVTIHTIDCSTLAALGNQPERWLDVAWNSDYIENAPHIGRINVMVTNHADSMGHLCTVIGKNAGNISNLKITHRALDFFEMILDIEVKDARHLTLIIAALRASTGIGSVDRAKA